MYSTVVQYHHHLYGLPKGIRRDKTTVCVQVKGQEGIDREDRARGWGWTVKQQILAQWPPSLSLISSMV